MNGTASLKLRGQFGRQAFAACLVLASLGPIGCTSDAVTLGFGPSDVEQVAVFLYAYGEDALGVSRSVVADRIEIAGLVQAYTDVPVRPLRLTAEEVRGADAAGLRFVLRDGQVSELTQVFLGPKSVVLVWPDGRAVSTERGAPTAEYGTPSDPAANEPVDSGEQPRAVIP